MKIYSDGKSRVLNGAFPKHFRLLNGEKEVPFIRTGRESIRISGELPVGDLLVDEIVRQKVAQPAKLDAQSLAIINKQDFDRIDILNKKLAINQEKMGEQMNALAEHEATLANLETKNAGDIELLSGQTASAVQMLKGAIEDTEKKNVAVQKALSQAIKETGEDLSDSLVAHETAKNPHRITKATVGLDKVENIKPEDMPVSKATKKELDKKADKKDIAEVEKKLTAKSDGIIKGIERMNMLGGVGGNELPVGGKKGQVLAKASNKTGDYEWSSAAGGVSVHNDLTGRDADKCHPISAIDGLQTALTTETTNRENADNGLQSQIDAITASSDVKDIVGTYAELQAYDTSTLGNNDIIKVLQDETHDDETTYYRWNSTTQTFSLIGAEGPYYTKSESNSLFQPAGSYVTTNTAQTISATKTFSARQDFSSNLSDKIYLKHGQMDITTTPSAKRSNTINFRDKNAVTMGYVTQQQDTDGSSKIRLVASTYETGTTNFNVAAFEIKAYKDGTLESYIDTPPVNSNDNNIANTEWVKLQNYVDSTALTTTLADYVTIAGDETISGGKTFTKAVTIQNGAGTGALTFGADVNASTVTNNTRKLGRINSPSYASGSKPTATLLGWDTQGDTGQDGMHTANKATDVVAFGGMKKITTNTSPMNIVFCVTDTRGATAAANKIYPLEMDANEARFNVQPNYNGTNLATVNDIVTSLGGLTDVTVTTPTSGQVLSYDGSKWVNSSTGAGVTDVEVNGTSVVSGGVASVSVPTQASDINALPDSTKYGADLSLTSSTLQLLDQDGNALGSGVTVPDTSYVDTAISTLLGALYPVGSLYIGTQASCPMAGLISGSTWELVSAGKALWTGNGTSGSGTTANSNYANAAANTTIAAGLPQHTHGERAYFDNNSAVRSLAENTETGGSAKSIPASGSIASGKNVLQTNNASNSIYGNSSTVQPPAYVVNVWRRTA